MLDRPAAVIAAFRLPARHQSLARSRNHQTGRVPPQPLVADLHDRSVVVDIISTNTWSPIRRTPPRSALSGGHPVELLRPPESHHDQFSRGETPDHVGRGLAKPRPLCVVSSKDNVLISFHSGEEKYRGSTAPAEGNEACIPPSPAGTDCLRHQHCSGTGGPRGVWHSVSFGGPEVGTRSESEP